MKCIHCGQGRDKVTLWSQIISFSDRMVVCCRVWL